LDQTQIKIIKNHADLVKKTVGKLDDDIQVFIEKFKTAGTQAPLIKALAQALYQLK
jgi:hypothetical protein